MSFDHLPPPPRSTANPAPMRPLGSIRRTTSIDVSWPDGVDGQRLVIGGARDLYTPADGSAPVVLAQGRYEARLTEDKTITAITAEPAHPGTPELVGARAGGHLRKLLQDVMPDLVANAHPLYLVLDDLSGAALVSAFAWSQWFPDWAEKLRARLGAEQHSQLMAQRVNVCWGLQEGNSGMSDAVPRNVADADAGDVRNPADPLGWHELVDAEGAGFRRVRRLDVTLDRASNRLVIDSAFQDSATRPNDGPVAIHEYLLRATADATTLELLSIEPEARILPFSECPGAIANTQRLVGRRLDQVRDDVLAQLRGPAGCTHLNDALRALADTPALAEGLREPA